MQLPPVLALARMAHLKRPGIQVTFQEKAMDYFLSNRCSDEQLKAILHQTSQWAVNGRQDRVLCRTASLRLAIDRAAEFSRSGAVVIAICRLPSDNIIIFSEQIDRLRRTIEVQELMSGE